MYILSISHLKSSQCHQIGAVWQIHACIFYMVHVDVLPVAVCINSLSLWGWQTKHSIGCFHGERRFPSQVWVHPHQVLLHDHLQPVGPARLSALWKQVTVSFMGSLCGSASTLRPAAPAAQSGFSWLIVLIVDEMGETMAEAPQEHFYCPHRLCTFPLCDKHSWIAELSYCFYILKYKFSLGLLSTPSQSQ